MRGSEGNREKVAEGGLEMVKIQYTFIKGSKIKFKLKSESERNKHTQQHVLIY